MIPLSRMYRRHAAEATLAVICYLGMILLGVVAAGLCIPQPEPAEVTNAARP